MPFGKHKGKPIRQLPRTYLVWLAGQCDLRGPLAEEVRATLRGESTPDYDELLAELFERDEQRMNS